MQTYTEMLAELGSRLMVADNSTLYTATRLGNLIQNAHFRATGYKDWPELVRAKVTTTTTDTYYDYPEEFRTDSISRVVINEKIYEKKNYEDFLNYKDENSDSLNAYTAGLTMDVYGCIQPEQLSQSITTTIFSKSDETGNEAIVKMALHDALIKTNSNLAIQEENEAKTILENIWKRIANRQQSERRLNRPMFNVPDFLGSKVSIVVPEPMYIFADYQRKIFVASFK